MKEAVELPLPLFFGIKVKESGYKIVESQKRSEYNVIKVKDSQSQTDPK